MRKSILFTLIIILVLVFSGCSKESIGNAQNPAYDDDSLYMLKYELMSEAGELYGLKLDKENYLIAKDVRDRHFYVNQENNEILYVNEENNLYKVLNEENIKIASNIRPDAFTDAENYKYFFVDNDSGALYYITENNEKEKIAEPDEGKFVISEDRNAVAFIDDGNLYFRRIAENDKIKISTDTDTFFLSSKGNIIMYLRNGRGFYIRDLRDKNEEVYKLSNDYIIDCQIDINEKNIFLTKFNSDNNELCYVDEKFELQNVANDINWFSLDSNGKFVLYLNNDDNLFSYDIEKKESEKIGTDISYFQLDKNGDAVIYTNNDNGFYSYANGKEAVKIADDVLNYNISNGNIFYYTLDNELFYKQADKDAEKISDNVKNYCISRNGKDAAYIADDSIYIKIKGKESVKAIEKASDYNKIYYSNQPLYEKVLQLSDLDGYWMHESYSEISHIDSKSKPGKLKYYTAYNTIDAEDLEIVESNETRCLIKTSASEYNFEEIYIELIDDDSIYINDNIFNKIDKKKFDDTLFSKEKIIGEWYNNEFSDEIQYTFTMTDSQIIYNMYYYNYYGLDEEHKFIFDYEIDNYGLNFAGLNLNLVKYSFSGEEQDINEYKNNITSLKVYYESDDNSLNIMELEFNSDYNSMSFSRNTDSNLTDIRENFINSMLSEDYLYSYYYVTTEGIKAYESYSESSPYIGTLSLYDEYYIEDIKFDDSGNLWLKSNTYDSYSWEYTDFWFMLPEESVENEPTPESAV
jgi:hypothetical protein